MPGGPYVNSETGLLLDEGFFFIWAYSLSYLSSCSAARSRPTTTHVILFRQVPHVTGRRSRMGIRLNRQCASQCCLRVVRTSRCDAGRRLSEKSAAKPRLARLLLGVGTRCSMQAGDNG